MQVGVPGEIEVVDLRTLEDSCLLWANVRRKKEDPVCSVVGGQGGSPSVQLCDHSSDVLVAEMSLLFNEVPDRSADGLPDDNAVNNELEIVMNFQPNPTLPQPHDGK